MGEDRRASLRQQVAGLEAYARLKLEARDWHGLQDAAMDIREVVAQLSEIDRLEALSQLQTTAKLQAALPQWANQAQSSNLGAGLWPPPSSAVDPTAYNPPMQGAATQPPQCQALVIRPFGSSMGERCVMIAGHQGEHMNAAEWRAESR